MRQIVYSLTLSAAVNNAVCLDQTRVGAGALTINGTLATGGVATFAVAYTVSVTSTGNDSSRTYTITGTNANGQTISETITGPNTTTVYTTRYFKTVTGVSVVGGGTVGTVRVGFGTSGVTPTIPIDNHGRPEISLQAVVSGTATWTIQQTLDNPWESATLNWFDHSDPLMVGQTVSRQGNYAYVPAAVRLKITSGTGTVTFTVVQSGDFRA